MTRSKNKKNRAKVTNSSVNVKPDEKNITSETAEQEITTNPSIQSPQSQALGDALGTSTKNENKRKRMKEKKHGGSNQGTTEHQTGDKSNGGNQNSDRKKIGGIIFICDERTKPDCFRFGVMGITEDKKEIVMDIKPGLNLFLYDISLKMMYGVYEASSAGGMKLEPKAFGGRFPAQVRFKLHKEYLPIHESVFKKAITENYNEKTRKFKTELTYGQVKRLTVLFSDATRLHGGVKISIDEYAPSHVHSRPQLSLTEKEYRNHGLQPERSILIATSPTHMLKNRGSGHSQTDRQYPNEKEYRAYGLKGSQSQGPPPVCDPYDDSTASLINRYLSMPSASTSYYPQRTLPVETSYPSLTLPNEVSYPPRTLPNEVSYPPRTLPAEASSYPPRTLPNEAFYPPSNLLAEASYPPRTLPTEASYPPRTLPNEASYPPRTLPNEASYPPRTLLTEGSGSYLPRTLPAEGSGSYPPRTLPASGSGSGSGSYLPRTLPAEGSYSNNYGLIHEARDPLGQGQPSSYYTPVISSDNQHYRHHHLDSEPNLASSAAVLSRYSFAGGPSVLRR